MDGIQLFNVSDTYRHEGCEGRCLRCQTFPQTLANTRVSSELPKGFLARLVYTDMGKSLAC